MLNSEDRLQLFKGDCLEVMKEFQDCSIELKITDSHYGIDLTPQRENGKFKNTKVINDDNLDWLPKLVDELYPIKMPYYPPDKPYKVHMTDFLFDPKNGDFDTLAVFYIVDPEGNKIVINRYFREPHENETETIFGWVEITEDEYLKRKAVAVNREV